MSEKIQAVRGMHDILPPHTALWQTLETILRNVARQYGYHEIRLPVLEKTSLYSHAIGDETDIVSKEMYTFTDKNGEELTLRPEGTAGCVRASIQHGLLRQAQRLWYMGPMFRHERPQKGRQRQFHQFGVEAYGMQGPDIDAEIILLAQRVFQQLQISPLTLHINTLGTAATRKQYTKQLQSFLQDRIAELDTDCQRRLHTNPLRILDSKNPDMQALLQQAPTLADALDAESADHFAALTNMLKAHGVAYVWNKRLVRGLDYYDKTVFEWISPDLGAQATVCAGGRYDYLTQRFAAPVVPAIGFAIGLERLLALLSNTNIHVPSLHLYVVWQGETAWAQALQLTEKLRDSLPWLAVQIYCGQTSLKRQFKRADQSGAVLGLIFGEDEQQDNSVQIKWLRADKPQTKIAQTALVNWLNQHKTELAGL